MDKCNICAHLREAGNIPVCVKNCSGRAIMYGDINDPQSDVSKMLVQAGSGHVIALRNSGNDPCGRFILRGAQWIDVLPQEYEKQIKEGYQWKKT
jgi:Fe-S-cluster-containing dehydrogenase component